jgi:hypothetical protein
MSLVVFDLVALAGMFLARVDAAPTDVGLSPSEGVVGTTVTVTGSGCFPSLLVNPAHVSVTGVTLGVNVDAAVPAEGAWSIQFVVPTNAIEGPHVIGAACVAGLGSYPYVPLTFTVTAPPASSTTLIPTTTIAINVTTSTPAPLTTVASVLGTSTTIINGAADPSGGGGEGQGTRPVQAGADAATTTQQSASIASGPTTTSLTPGESVSASRVEHDRKRQPLGFGSLSPIGDGWLGALVSALLAVLVLSGLLAMAWFVWLRHTRARGWWLRWMSQITDIRSHARPDR